MTNLEQYFEVLYGTVTGDLLPEFKVPGIPNEFEPGGDCYAPLCEIYAAIEQIQQRLGVQNDEDCERILNAQLEIERVLCQRMFFYGLYSGSRLNKEMD